MYLRTTQRRRRDGSPVRYLQLAHNEWDARAGYSKVRVLYNFGREDELDRAAIERLIRSLARALEPGAALAATAAPELRFLDSRPMGGAYLLDGLWRRLGIDATLARLLAGRRLDPRAERVLFALVANRALEPLSKLAATQWVAERVAIPGLAGVDDSCYRSMDFLLEVEPELAEAVYWATADLLNLEVDLLFFDTTSSYFEIDEPDTAVAGGTGFRVLGKSKDHRDDLPQIVVGLAVTRTGIPIRVWCWPGRGNVQLKRCRKRQQGLEQAATTRRADALPRSSTYPSRSHNLLICRQFDLERRLRHHEDTTATTLRSRLSLREACAAPRGRGRRRMAATLAHDLLADLFENADGLSAGDDRQALRHAGAAACAGRFRRRSACLPRGALRHKAPAPPRHSPSPRRASRPACGGRGGRARRRGSRRPQYRKVVPSGPMMWKPNRGPWRRRASQPAGARTLFSFLAPSHGWRRRCRSILLLPVGWSRRAALCRPRRGRRGSRSRRCSRSRPG
jgi:hypothetical protein